MIKLFETVVGSRVYNLHTPTSDTDIRGIFVIPTRDFNGGFKNQDQVNDKKNDIVHYELGRYSHLLMQSNPNITELLWTDSEFIKIHSPSFSSIYKNRTEWLSKQMKNTFGGYAISQIKKARGLNKKVVNPMPKKRKTPLDFCYIFEKEDGYMMLAEQWLRKNRFRQENIGLAEMPNGVQLYKVYYDWIGEEESTNPRFDHKNTQERFKGIIKDDSDELRHSSIPKGEPLMGFLYYNKDGYSSYCKDYKEYWEWVEKRNPHRYHDNVSHGQNYDGKNLMHCVRLIETAIDVAKYGEVRLRRPNRDFLMSIRMGEHKYDDIIKLINDREIEMTEAFGCSGLPEKPNQELLHELVADIRDMF